MFPSYSARLFNRHTDCYARFCAGLRIWNCPVPSRTRTLKGLNPDFGKDEAGSGFSLKPRFKVSLKSNFAFSTYLQWYSSSNRIRVRSGCSFFSRFDSDPLFLKCGTENPDQLLPDPQP